MDKTSNRRPAWPDVVRSQSRRRKQQQRQVLRSRLLPYFTSQRQSVHIRQLQVENRRVKWLALAEQPQRVPAVQRLLDDHSPLFGPVFDNAPIGGIILHNQQPFARQLWLRALPGGRRGGRSRARQNREMKCCSLTGIALHPDFSAHQLG